MIRDDLKNYSIYMSKLLKYMKAVSIKIKYKSLSCDGMFIPTKREVQIDANLENSDEVATILHELGHSIDDLMDTSQSNSLYRAYKATYEDRASSKQKALVVQCETRAWALGQTIAKQIGIPLGKWYFDIAKKCLKSYKS